MIIVHSSKVGLSVSKVGVFNIPRWEFYVSRVGLLFSKVGLLFYPRWDLSYSKVGLFCKNTTKSLQYEVF